MLTYANQATPPAAANPFTTGSIALGLGVGYGEVLGIVALPATVTAHITPAAPTDPAIFITDISIVSGNLRFALSANTPLATYTIYYSYIP